MSSNTPEKTLEDFLLAINEGSIASLQQELEELHPADIAELIDEIDFDETKEVINLLSSEKTAEVIVELDEDLRERLLKEYSVENIAHDFVENLDSDDAADLINELPKERQREVLFHMEDPIQAQALADLLIYQKNSAGALMATELIKVNQNWRVLQCVKEMRKQAEHIDRVHSIYVVDDDNNLLGTLSLKKLLTTSTKTPISEVYDSKIQSVEATEDGEEVALQMQKYDLVVLPVVDAMGHLLGRITIDDVIDLIREEAKEDYNLASGLTNEVESDSTVGETTKARLPWLLIGLLGGIAAASVIGKFEGALDTVPKLLFFTPLIAAMGGNVGVQSSAIIVQALAAKENLGGIIPRLLKELAVALINGIICAAVVFVAGLFLGYELNLSITIGISLLVVVIVAALVGTFTPIALDKYKIDPALATGPFITTMNDIVGLFIYFSIGKLILGF